MIEGVNFIGISESSAGTESIQAVDPSTNKPLEESFFIATDDEINRAVSAAKKAYQTYSTVSGEVKATFLDTIADEILNLGDTLIQRASRESGLTNGRFEGERGRTVGQLRMFAELLREGSWVDARLDTKEMDIRNMQFPLGPVVVFGASNFPLAFSTAGGDTASALAAGCPVIVKAHESHPGTNELVARAILKAAEKTEGIPNGVFSSLNGKADLGQKLVQHPDVKAIGFTGSLKAGNAIYKSAAQRSEPIPVYAEMGSVNPVFLLSGKVNNSPEELAEQYSQSVTLGNGQFCTKPGLLIGVKSEGLNSFKIKLAGLLNDYTPDCMLNEGIAKNYAGKRDHFFNLQEVQTLTNGANEEGLNRAASLASVDASHFLSNKELWEEVFGPFTLVVECEDDEQLKTLAKNLKGQLTITLMGEEYELNEQSELLHLCRQRAGRIIFNGVPTGVAVVPSMHHGGPYPATTDSKFTSVGTGAIRRFTRPVAFQDVNEKLLPDELKSDNPLDIWRLVNGTFQK